MSPDRGPAPIRASLEKLLAGLGSPEIDSMTMLVERWPEVVGERLAERIQAVAVRRRELLVTVTILPGPAKSLGWKPSYWSAWRALWGRVESSPFESGWRPSEGAKDALLGARRGGPVESPWGPRRALVGPWRARVWGLDKGR